jgi:hypothetical protein
LLWAYTPYLAEQFGNLFFHKLFHCLNPGELRRKGY